MTRVLLIAAVAGMLLIGGCAAERMRADMSSEAKDYPREMAAAQKAGVPLSMADFVRPLPPAGQNAATYYYALENALEKRPLAGQDEILDGLATHKMPTAQQLADAKKALGDRADLIRFIHQAASKKQCVFAKDWTMDNPANILFPELAKMREAVRILTAQSLVLASEGKTQEAVENEALGFRIADHSAADRDLIAYLVSVAIDAITITELQKILFMSHGDPRVAGLVRQAVEAEYHPQSLSAAYDSEIAFQQGIFAYLRAGDFNTLEKLTEDSGSQEAKVPTGLTHGSAGWNEFLDANDAFTLQEMLRIHAAASLPYAQAKKVGEAVDKDLQDSTRLSHYVGEIVMPAYDKTIDKKEQIQAMAETTEAGAAVLEWKGAHGTYPARLSQAMPKVPIDPFDGKPLRYRRKGEGFVIYSVGPTGKFDGGMPSVKPAATETLFRYPMPAYWMPKN